MEITLTWREVRLAAIAGVDLRLRHLYLGTADRHGPASPQRGGWDTQIVGAIGEWAVAKALGLYWPGAMNKADVCGDIARFEVRSTTLALGGLIVYPSDRDDALYVLVVGMPPSLRIAGGMAGVDAKQDRWWRTDLLDHAYLVPQAELRPLSELVG